MSTFPKKDYPVKWIPVRLLSVLWAVAQRPLVDSKVEKIVETFDPDAFGVATVTLPNKAGMHHVIDGQNRVEAVRRLWGENEMVPCLVLNVSAPNDAARIWRIMNGTKFNTRTRPSAMQDFQVAITEGDPEAVEINDLVTGMGLRFGLGGDDGMISCISAVRSVYRKRGMDTLRETLLVIRSIWDRDRDAYHQNIVGGVAEVIATHNGDMDPKRLATKVSKEFTPARLIAAAKVARDFNGRTLTENVKLVLVNTYNKNLRPEDRLDEAA